MKNCIIHFGMYKTGSTSIQHSLWKKLNNSQWKYLDLGDPNHGVALNTILRDSLPKRLLLSGVNPQRFLKRKAVLQNRMLQELNESENFIISAELLSSPSLKLSELLAFRNLLSNHVDNIQVVGYIRSPKAYMESWFQEKLKHDRHELNFKRYPLHYKERISKLDEVFGKENVSVWKFDPTLFPNHCVVQDFCSRLGISITTDSIVKVNESLSREAVALLYTYRKFNDLTRNSEHIQQKDNLLVDRLSTLEGGKLRFSWQSISQVLNENATDIAWIENRMGDSFNEIYQQDDINTICTEDNLFQYSPESLFWLAQQLGVNYEKRYRPIMSKQKVAHWVQLLYSKLAKEAGLFS